MKTHRLKIDGSGIVGPNWCAFLDDKELFGVTRVEFDANICNQCIATITLYVEPEINIETEVVKEIIE